MPSDWGLWRDGQDLARKSMTGRDFLALPAGGGAWMSLGCETCCLIKAKE